MRNKILAIALATLIATAGFTVLKADSNSPPTQAEIDFAEETSGLLINSLVAGLVDVFLATVPANVEQGNDAIGTVFADPNKDIRLVGEDQPISEKNEPMDPFEVMALNLALAGQTYTDVQRVKGRWFFRSSVPLANSIPQCALCHVNFGTPSATDYKGALMVRVRIPGESP